LKKIKTSCVHFERVTDETVDWNTAKDECEKADGVLAYFENSEEYDKFSQQMELGGSDEWLGIKRSSSDGWSTAKGRDVHCAFSRSVFALFCAANS
jgi:hypothetical protein